jgi:ferric-dicitrate binding protein FerR (iron transport regulator)
VRRRGAWPIYGVGAAAGALCLVAVMWWNGGMNVFLSASRPATIREYATQRAQRAQLELPDGSRVTLAPETRIRYTASAGGTRTVTLEGRAYFEVTQGAATPFIVETGAVRTRVLGTTFDVQHYREDDVVQVAVMTGKVATGGRGAPVVLTPGMVAQVTDSTATTNVVRDIGAVTGWTSGRLIFVRTRVPQMLDVVGRWCGYEFRLADPTLASQHVTTVLTVDDPAKTLVLLKSLLNVTMTFDGNVVTLHADGHSRDGRSTPSAPANRGGRDAFSISPEIGK